MQKSFQTTIQERLDAFLTVALESSRNQVAQLIKASYVHVEGHCVIKPGLMLKPNQTVDVTLPEMVPSHAPSIDFDVSVLYEDDALMVIDKPSGLTVHPAASVREPTLVDWLKAQGVSLSTLSGQERHGIVHRLDKGTSGAMVVAKSNSAHEHLATQLLDRSMGRYYLALIDIPLKESCIVDKPLGRNARNRLKMGIHESGKPAKTAFAKLLTAPDGRHELIACKLYSGRTHQIRVHLETLSRHILGDHLYGSKHQKDKIERIFLHAYILYLVHPVSGEKMEFVAPIPKDLQETLAQLFTGDTLHAQTWNDILEPHRLKHAFDDTSHWVCQTTAPRF